MRAVVQRVAAARVEVDGETVGEIGPGLLALVGVARGDDPSASDALAAKIAGLRIFEDDAGKMNRAVGDIGGAVLVVSQFTLLGDARGGRRPSFIDAARGDAAEALVERVVAALRATGICVATGRFGASMDVTLTDRGPVTILLDTERRF